MANRRSGVGSWLALIGWFCGGSSALMGALVVGLPGWVGRATEGFISVPRNQSGGGFTADFVENQVTVFWMAITLVALVTVLFLFATILHGRCADAKSIARGEGWRWLSWLPFALVLLGAFVTFARIPRSVFVVVDEDRLSANHALASFILGGPMGKWIFAVVAVLACAALAWFAVRVGWVKGLRGWKLSKFREVVGKANA